MFEPQQTATRDPLQLECAFTMTRLTRKNPPPRLQSPDAGRTSPLHSPIQTFVPIKPGIQSPGVQSLTGKRLQRHADYQRAYAASRKRQSSSMSWFLARQTPAYAGAALPASPRVGLTAGKVLGKAHERNRIKRRMREALRRHAEMLPAGFDLILHPRRFVLTLEFAKLEAEIVRILHQAQAEAARMPQEAPDAMTRGTL
jgi:ribonuclease P protein component